jgi:hypothetical protein
MVAEPACAPPRANGRVVYAASCFNRPDTDSAPRELRPISLRCKAVNDPKFVALQGRRSTPVVSAAASTQRFAEPPLSPTA